MAEWRSVGDWLEDRRQADKRRAEEPEDPHITRMRELGTRGVTPRLAALIYWSDYYAEDMSEEALRDAAEAVTFKWLAIGVDPDDSEEVAICRRQARYARNLYVNMKFLERNVDRDIQRLWKRRTIGDRRRRRRPHSALGVLTWEQRARAEYLWRSGAHHGLSFHRAMYVSARDDPAVYRRVHRILRQAREDVST